MFLVLSSCIKIKLGKFIDINDNNGKVQSSQKISISSVKLYNSVFCTALKCYIFESKNGLTLVRPPNILFFTLPSLRQHIFFLYNAFVH